MDNFRDLPKSIKWLIGLVTLTIILLITNFIFFKMYTKEEPFNPMAYYQEMVGGTEKEILDRFERANLKYDKDINISKASENINKLLSVSKELPKDINTLFENKNVRLNDVENIEDYNGLIISYGLKEGFSDKELSEIIKNYKKTEKGKVYAYSDKGLDGSQIYYKVALKKYYYDNELDVYKDLDKRYKDNKFDSTHIYSEKDFFTPQFFVVEKGALNLEKTESLTQDNMKFNNMKGEISVGVDYFDKQTH